MSNETESVVLLVNVHALFPEASNQSNSFQLVLNFKILLFEIIISASDLDQSHNCIQCMRNLKQIVIFKTNWPKMERRNKRNDNERQSSISDRCSCLIRLSRIELVEGNSQNTNDPTILPRTRQVLIYFIDNVPT